MAEIRTPIDLSYLTELSQEDASFEQDLFSDFLGSCKNYLAQMEQAVKDSNNDLWYKSAHSLRGASASVGAFDLSKLFDYAQNHKQKLELMKKIEDELKLVSEFIKKRGN